MGEPEMVSVSKQTLKNLCCSNGWSYGIFWRFDQRNSMLLTMEDAYYEKQMGPLIDIVLLKSHILGEGIIGQAAFTGRHQWILSDSRVQGWGSNIGNQDVFQDVSEFQTQFSFGIKTIAIISVETRGVFEFGSTHKIMERLEFLDETRKSFYAMESFHGLRPLANETLVSSGNFNQENPTTQKGGRFREPERRLCSATNLNEPSCFMHEIQDKRMNTQQQNLSHLRSQLQTSRSIGAQMTPSGKTAPVNHLGADSTCTSTWSNNEGSILTSFGTTLPAERETWDSQNVLHINKTGLVLGGNMEENFQSISTLTSIYSRGEMVDAEIPTVDSFGETVENQHPYGTNGELLDSVINLHGVPGEFNQADFTKEFSNSIMLDDLSQWFDPSPQHNIDGARDTMTSDLSYLLGGGDAVIEVPVRQTANSSQSSITDTFISNVENSTNICDGNNLFDGVRPDCGFGKSGESLEDIVMPLLHGDNSAMGSGMSELGVCSMSGKRKGLFSELGLEELLDDLNNSSVSKSSFEDQFSNSQRRKTESSSSNFQGQFAGLSCSGGSINLGHHSLNWDKSNTMLNKELHKKSRVGLWIDDSCSVNAGPPVVAALKKPTRKRANPGESTRPRPKDRQLIQDRIKELRGIIPHNGKQLSIDVLLARTIKHLLFLQGVIKYADKIKQADEPKLISQEIVTLAKQNQMSDGGGASWAYEVGAQTIPIVVKDLNPPGHMLIEMLCEDRGFLLEIADVIRGFGLNILKGVMEVQEDKIWARFIVEAKQQVERTTIIWSLLLLLQQSDNSGIDSTNRPSKAIDNGVSLSHNYQQSLLLPPISMADSIQ